MTDAKKKKETTPILAAAANKPLPQPPTRAVQDTTEEGDNKIAEKVKYFNII